MRILQRNLKWTTDTHLQTHTTDTHYRHTQTHTTDTHYRHTLTDTHYRHTLQTHTTDTHLQTHTTDTHYRHTLQTHSFSFLTQRTYCCNIFIGVRIIKEMPGSVASGTRCTIAMLNLGCLGVQRIDFRRSVNLDGEKLQLSFH